MPKQGISTGAPNDLIGRTWVKHAPKIYKQCAGRTKSEEEAKDLFQDVALKFCKNAGRLRLDEPLDGWFTSVIRTCFCDTKRRVFEELPMSSLKEESANYEVFPEKAAMFFSDDRQEQQLRETVEVLLKSLSPIEKFVVDVSYIGGFTLSELARDFGTPRCVLCRRRNMALAKLRKTCEETGKARKNRTR